MRKTGFSLRIFSSLITLTFFLNDLAFAALDFKPAEIAIFQKALPVIQFPPSIAVIEDTYRAKSAKTLFLIQDAHTNESGQFNSSKALEKLIKEEKIKYVFLEAGTGDDSLSYFRNKAVIAKRIQVGKSYLKKGLLSGPEYLDLISDLQFILWGVENKELYWKALEAYRAVAEGREKFEDYLKRIEVTIGVLKPRLFNATLASFDEKRDAYLKERLSLTDYFEALTNEAEKRNITLQYFPHFASLKTVRKKEKAIDFAKANEEQAKALSLFSKDELTELFASQPNQSPFKVSSQDRRVQKAFYAVLEEKIRKQSQLPLTPSLNKEGGNSQSSQTLFPSFFKEGTKGSSLYPELSKYFAYLKEAQKIDPKALLEEQKLLENQIYSALLSNEDERALHKASENLRALKGLIGLTLTPEEFKAYKDDPKGYDTAFITGFLNQKIAELKNLYERAVFLENGYEKYIQQAEKFYALTYERDHAFVDNLLKKMNDGHVNKAALVAGGYHTPNLKALLKANNLSYIVVTPQVYQETNHKRYEKLLLDQKLDASLKDEGRGTKDAIGRNSSPASSDDHIALLRAADNTFVWRQISADLQVKVEEMLKRAGGEGGATPGTGGNGGWTPPVQTITTRQPQPVILNERQRARVQEEVVATGARLAIRAESSAARGARLAINKAIIQINQAITNLPASHLALSLLIIASQPLTTKGNIEEALGLLTQAREEVERSNKLGSTYDYAPALKFIGAASQILAAQLSTASATPRVGLLLGADKNAPRGARLATARRDFIKQIALASVGAAVTPLTGVAAEDDGFAPLPAGAENKKDLSEHYGDLGTEDYSSNFQAYEVTPSELSGKALTLDFHPKASLKGFMVQVKGDNGKYVLQFKKATEQYQFVAGSYTGKKEEDDKKVGKTLVRVMTMSYLGKDGKSKTVIRVYIPMTELAALGIDRTTQVHLHHGKQQYEVSDLNDGNKNIFTADDSIELAPRVYVAPMPTDTPASSKGARLAEENEGRRTKDERRENESVSSLTPRPSSIVEKGARLANNRSTKFDRSFYASYFEIKGDMEWANEQLRRPVFQGMDGFAMDDREIPDSVLNRLNRFQGIHYPISEPVTEKPVPAKPILIDEWLDSKAKSAPYIQMAEMAIAQGKVAKQLLWGGQAFRAQALLGGGAKSRFSLTIFASQNLDGLLKRKEITEDDYKTLLPFQKELKEKIESLTLSDMVDKYLFDLSLGAHEAIQYHVELEKLARKRGVNESEVKNFIRANGKLIVSVNSETGDDIVKEWIDNHFFGFDRRNIIFVVTKTFPVYVRDKSGKLVVMDEKVAREWGLEEPIRHVYGHGLVRRDMSVVGTSFLIDSKGNTKMLTSLSPYEYMLRRGAEILTNANVEDVPQLTGEALPIPRIALFKYLQKIRAVETIFEGLENPAGNKGGYLIKNPEDLDWDISVEGSALKDGFEKLQKKKPYLNRMLVVSDLRALQNVTRITRRHLARRMDKTTGKYYYYNEAYFTDTMTHFMKALSFAENGRIIQAFKEPKHLAHIDGKPLSYQNISEGAGLGPIMLLQHRDRDFLRAAKDIYMQSNYRNDTAGARLSKSAQAVEAEGVRQKEGGLLLGAGKSAPRGARLADIFGESVESLRSVMNDTSNDLWLRLTAAQSLGRIAPGNTDAINFLRNVMNDTSNDLSLRFTAWVQSGARLAEKATVDFIGDHGRALRVEVRINDRRQTIIEIHEKNPRTNRYEFLGYVSDIPAGAQGDISIAAEYDQVKTLANIIANKLAVYYVYHPQAIKALPKIYDNNPPIIVLGPVTPSSMGKVINISGKRKVDIPEFEVGKPQRFIPVIADYSIQIGTILGTGKQTAVLTTLHKGPSHQRVAGGELGTGGSITYEGVRVIFSRVKMPNSILKYAVFEIEKVGARLAKSPLTLNFGESFTIAGGKIRVKIDQTSSTAQIKLLFSTQGREIPIYRRETYQNMRTPDAPGVSSLLEKALPAPVGDGGLVLGRYLRGSVVIGLSDQLDQVIEITVARISGRTVELAISHPEDVSISKIILTPSGVPVGAVARLAFDDVYPSLGKIPGFSFLTPYTTLDGRTFITRVSGIYRAFSLADGEIATFELQEDGLYHKTEMPTELAQLIARIRELYQKTSVTTLRFAAIGPNYSEIGPSFSRQTPGPTLQIATAQGLIVLIDMGTRKLEEFRASPGARLAISPAIVQFSKELFDLGHVLSIDLPTIADLEGGFLDEIIKARLVYSATTNNDGNLKLLQEMIARAKAQGQPDPLETEIKFILASDAALRDPQKKNEVLWMVYENLINRFVAKVAVKFLPIYEETSFRHGYVSTELPTAIVMAQGTAQDFDQRVQTIVQAGVQRFNATQDEIYNLIQLQRRARNILLKIPATDLGLNAGEELEALGYNVNYTLVATKEQYRATVRAHKNGVQRFIKNYRAQHQGSLPALHLIPQSVSSDFVSRDDRSVAPILDEVIKEVKSAKLEAHQKIAGIASQIAPEKLVEEARYLRGNGPENTSRAAIAFAQGEIANIFNEEFAQDPVWRRFVTGIAETNPQYVSNLTQQIYWASTGVKVGADYTTHPFYLGSVIMRDSTDTVPRAVIEAIAKASEAPFMPKAVTTRNIESAKADLLRLKAFGIDLDHIKRYSILPDGLKSFDGSDKKSIDLLNEAYDRVAGTSGARFAEGRVFEPSLRTNPTNLTPRGLAVNQVPTASATKPGGLLLGAENAPRGARLAESPEDRSQEKGSETGVSGGNASYAVQRNTPLTLKDRLRQPQIWRQSSTTPSFEERLSNPSKITPQTSKAQQSEPMLRTGQRHLKQSSRQKESSTDLKPSFQQSPADLAQTSTHSSKANLTNNPSLVKETTSATTGARLAVNVLRAKWLLWRFPFDEPGQKSVVSEILRKWRVSYPKGFVQQASIYALKTAKNLDELGELLNTLDEFIQRLSFQYASDSALREPVRSLQGMFRDEMQHVTTYPIEWSSMPWLEIIRDITALRRGGQDYIIQFNPKRSFEDASSSIFPFVNPEVSPQTVQVLPAGARLAGLSQSITDPATFRQVLSANSYDKDAKTGLWYWLETQIGDNPYRGVIMNYNSTTETVTFYGTDASGEVKVRRLTGEDINHKVTIRFVKLEVGQLKEYAYKVIASGARLTETGLESSVLSHEKTALLKTQDSSLKTSRSSGARPVRGGGEASNGARLAASIHVNEIASLVAGSFEAEVKALQAISRERFDSKLIVVGLGDNQISLQIGGVSETITGNNAKSLEGALSRLGILDRRETGPITKVPPMAGERNIHGVLYEGARLSLTAKDIRQFIKPLAREARKISTQVTSKPEYEKLYGEAFVAIPNSHPAYFVVQGLFRESITEVGSGKTETAALNAGEYRKLLEILAGKLEKLTAGARLTETEELPVSKVTVLEALREIAKNPSPAVWQETQSLIVGIQNDRPFALQNAVNFLEEQGITLPEESGARLALSDEIVNELKTLSGVLYPESNPKGGFQNRRLIEQLTRRLTAQEVFSFVKAGEASVQISWEIILRRFNELVKEKTLSPKARTAVKKVLVEANRALAAKTAKTAKLLYKTGVTEEKAAGLLRQYIADTKAFIDETKRKFFNATSSPLRSDYQKLLTAYYGSQPEAKIHILRSLSESRRKIVEAAWGWEITRVEEILDLIWQGLPKESIKNAAEIREIERGIVVGLGKEFSEEGARLADAEVKDVVDIFPRVNSNNEQVLEADQTGKRVVYFTVKFQGSLLYTPSAVIHYRTANAKTGWQNVEAETVPGAGPSAQRYKALISEGAVEYAVLVSFKLNFFGANREWKGLGESRNIKIVTFSASQLAAIASLKSAVESLSESDRAFYADYLKMLYLIHENIDYYLQNDNNAAKDLILEVINQKVPGITLLEVLGWIQRFADRSQNSDSTNRELAKTAAIEIAKAAYANKTGGFGDLTSVGLLKKFFSQNHSYHRLASEILEVLAARPAAQTNTGAAKWLPGLSVDRAKRWVHDLGRSDNRVQQTKLAISIATKLRDENASLFDRVLMPVTTPTNALPENLISSSDAVSQLKLWLSQAFYGYYLSNNEEGFNLAADLFAYPERRKLAASENQTSLLFSLLLNPSLVSERRELENAIAVLPSVDNEARSASFQYAAPEAFKSAVKSGTISEETANRWIHALYSAVSGLAGARLANNVPQPIEEAFELLESELMSVPTLDSKSLVETWIDAFRARINDGKWVSVLERMDFFFQDRNYEPYVKVKNGVVQKLDSRVMLEKAIFAHVMTPAFMQSQIDAINELLERLLSQPNHVLPKQVTDEFRQKMKKYYYEKEYGAVWELLKDFRAYLPKEQFREYNNVMRNMGLAIRLRLEKTEEWDASRDRSILISLINETRRTGNLSPNFELPEDDIAPPERGDLIAFEDDLPFFDNSAAIKDFAGDKLVRNAEILEANRIVQEEVDVAMVPGMGGLSIRGGIFADFDFWSRTLGWMRLGDLRLAQLAHAARGFHHRSLAIVESYFNHHKIQKMFLNRRADLSVFSDTTIIRSTVTPIIESSNGKTYLPYSPDGLGVASHLDLVLQPLFKGVIGDALVKAEKEGRGRDNVYLATFNMNVPMSVPSTKMIGHFHLLRKTSAAQTMAAESGKVVPFVAFQQVPLKGEKGGFLGYVSYKIKGGTVKILQIIEGFLTSKKTLEKIKQEKDKYLGFNSNHAVVALGGFVDFLFKGTGITDKDLTSERLKDRRNFERVLKIVNLRMVGIDSVDTYLATDFREKMGVFVERKPREGTNVEQVSSMLNAIATLGPGAVYYIQPRDISDDRMTNSVYSEYKEKNQTDIYREIESKKALITALTKERDDLDMKGGKRAVSLERRSALNIRLANLQGESELLERRYLEDSRDNLQLVADLSQEQKLLDILPDKKGKKGLPKEDMIDEVLRRMSNERTSARATVRVVVNEEKGERESFEVGSVTLNKLASLLWNKLPDHDVLYGELQISKLNNDLYRINLQILPFSDTTYLAKPTEASKGARLAEENFTLNKAALTRALQEIVRYAAEVGNESLVEQASQRLLEILSPRASRRDHVLASIFVRANASMIRSEKPASLPAGRQAPQDAPRGARLAELPAETAVQLHAWEKQHSWEARVVKTVQDWYSSQAVNDEQRAALARIVREGKADKVKAGFDSPVGIILPGTAGARSEMEDLEEGKIGPNFFSETTVIQYAHAFGRYFSKVKPGATVFVAKEVRQNSVHYGDILSKIYLSYGLKVARIPFAVSTPLTSFFSQWLKAQGEVVVGGDQISASHNGWTNNGLKFMGEFGEQLLPEAMKEVTANLDTLAKAKGIPQIDLLTQPAYREITATEKTTLYNAYFDAMEATLPSGFKEEVQRAAASGFRFVFTPLKGATTEETRLYLTERMGLVEGQHFFMVPEEIKTPEKTDDDYKAPNWDPARKGVLDRAYAYADKVGVTAVFARDPDGDRLVAAVKVNGDWQQLSGNDNGLVIFEDRLASANPADLKNYVYMRSHASSAEPDVVAEAYRVQPIVVPVGFKYFGAVIKDELGKWGGRYFGFEESYGLSTGSIAEKDSLPALVSMLKIAAKQYQKGENLLDRRDEIQARYGFKGNAILNYGIPGQDTPSKNAAKKRVLDTLDALKAGDKIGQLEILTKVTELKTVLGPQRDGYMFTVRAADGKTYWLLYRASGTEPIFKIYFSLIDGIKADSKEDLREKKPLVEKVRKPVFDQAAKAMDEWSGAAGARLTSDEADKQDEEFARVVKPATIEPLMAVSPLAGERNIHGVLYGSLITPGVKRTRPSDISELAKTNDHGMPIGARLAPSEATLQPFSKAALKNQSVDIIQPILQDKEAITTFLVRLFQANPLAFFDRSRLALLRGEIAPVFQVGAVRSKTGVVLSFFYEGHEILNIPNVNDALKWLNQTVDKDRQKQLANQGWQSIQSVALKRVSAVLPANPTISTSTGFVELSFKQVWEKLNAASRKSLSSTEALAVANFLLDGVRNETANVYLSDVTFFISHLDTKDAEALTDRVRSIQQVRGERGQVVTERPASFVITKIQFLNENDKPEPVNYQNKETTVYTAGFSNGSLPDIVASIREAQAVASFYQTNLVDSQIPVKGKALEELLERLKDSTVYEAIRAFSQDKNLAINPRTLHEVLTGQTSVLSVIRSFIIRPLLQFLDDRIRAIEAVRRALETAA